MAGVSSAGPCVQIPGNINLAYSSIAYRTCSSHSQNFLQHIFKNSLTICISHHIPGKYRKESHKRCCVSSARALVKWGKKRTRYPVGGRRPIWWIPQFLRMWTSSVEDDYCTMASFLPVQIKQLLCTISIMNYSLNSFCFVFFPYPYWLYGHLIISQPFLIN